MKKKLSDFEENLFLHAHIKELNDLLRKQETFIKKQNVEMGVLRSERDEWQANYEELFCRCGNIPDDKIKLKSFEKNMTDIKWFQKKIFLQRELIKSLENKIHKLKKQIS